MHFDVHTRGGLQDRLARLAAQMHDWEVVPRLSDDEAGHLRDAVQTFPHTTRRPDLTIGGVDGSGDYPSLTYGDSFIYFTIAQATLYRSDPLCGLREVAPPPESVYEFTWLPESEDARNDALDDAFAVLAGLPLDAVIEQSDYRTLKSAESRKANTVASLRDGLLRPHAADSANLAIQFRTTGEFGAALRLLRSLSPPDYLLVDTTLSLPLLNNPANSLFYEHLKRLCCVEARKRGTVLVALSKSHGLPAMENIEQIAREKQNLPQGQPAEHWYLRLPSRHDAWTFSLAQGRRLPPPGAVSYLVRFHHTTPTLRVDLDYAYWREKIRASTDEETRAREQSLFADLDYACHDQRCYGYPYPLKAGHDRASLTKAERTVLRAQIVDAAVHAGMKRSLFRSAALATGHE